MATIYLGLGSNLGDRDQNIRKALDLFAAKSISLENISTIIETEAVGGPIQGKFLNAAVKAHTDLSPHALLNAIQDIEKTLGRTRTIRNGPRTIDIDILLYDDLRLDLPDLVIPHPRISARAFVLEPLKEIAPEIAKSFTVHKEKSCASSQP